MHPATNPTIGVRRIALLAAIITAAVAASLVVGAEPADASTPYCRIAAWQGTSERTIMVPQAASGWRCHMARGAYSPAVTTLQRSLNTCYPAVIGQPLKVDGNYGSRTQTALLRVQRHLHIRRDGVYGPQTALTMRHLADHGGCDTLSHPGG